jgi:hypothetical protein
MAVQAEFRSSATAVSGCEPIDRQLKDWFAAGQVRPAGKLAMCNLTLKFARGNWRMEWFES